VRALLGREGPFYRTMKVLGLIESGEPAQARALGF
jgi:hypothetical protein